MRYQYLAANEDVKMGDEWRTTPLTRGAKWEPVRFLKRVDGTAIRPGIMGAGWSFRRPIP